jgi:1,4-dihydroxy-2-naphthoate octaprenyltransferase
MLGRLLTAAGVILVILALLVLFGVLVVGTVGWATLLIIGIICVVLGEFVLGGFYGPGHTAWRGRRY